MKKEALFVIFLIFAVFLFNQIHISGHVTVYIGDETEVGGKTVVIEQISSNSVVLNVNGLSDIARLNDQKDIGGVRVLVQEIFYVDEKEGRFAQISLESLYSCGDGNCEGDETSSNCCGDCGCSSGYTCEDEKCIQESTSKKYDECDDWKDCEDNNELTIDKCEGTPKKCTHITYLQCETDIDCDDGNKCTEDECVGNECYNTQISGCKSSVNAEELKKVLNKDDTTGKEKKGFLSKLFSVLFGWLG